MSFILKLAAIGWVGGSLFMGLLINGETIYGNIGNSILAVRDEICRKLDLMFIEITPERCLRLYTIYLFSCFGLGVFGVYSSLGTGPYFLAQAFIMGTLCTLFYWKLPLLVINILFKRRVKKFVIQMVDGLSLMSNAMRSGLNVPQALSLVSEELSNPISQEFALVLSQNKLGVSLEDAMSNLSVRMPHDDIEMFTTSVNILKETGGNLAETFDSIAYTIRERIKVESKISAMVSQGVMQGIIVVLMPFALGAVLYSIDPDRIRPMFTTIPGWVLLTAMMSLQAIGAWAIWKIIQVRV